MRPWCRTVLSAVVLVALSAGAAPAQDDDNRGGIGVFLDWIHKLSGPPFAGFGGNYVYGRPGDGLRLRIGVSMKLSYNESRGGSPNDRIEIHMLSIQPTLEYGIKGADVDFGGGFSLDLFTSSEATRVLHWSFPLYLQYRSRNDPQWQPRVAGMVRIMPAFPDDAFSALGPLNIKRRSGVEFVFSMLSGVDLLAREP